MEANVLLPRNARKNRHRRPKQVKSKDKENMFSFMCIDEQVNIHIDINSLRCVELRPSYSVATYKCTWKGPGSAYRLVCDDIGYGQTSYTVMYRQMVNGVITDKAADIYDDYADACGLSESFARLSKMCRICRNSAYARKIQAKFNLIMETFDQVLRVLNIHLLDEIYYTIANHIRINGINFPWTTPDIAWYDPEDPI